MNFVYHVRFTYVRSIENMDRFSFFIYFSDVNNGVCKFRIGHLQFFIALSFDQLYNARTMFKLSVNMFSTFEISYIFLDVKWKLAYLNDQYITHHNT